MNSTPAGFFVPTLDIDLAWHTHQLKADKYKRDCATHVGRYIDQYASIRTNFYNLAELFAFSDDKIEENTLSSAFDITCRAWQVSSSYMNI
jgi:hypothetical protein